VFRVVVGGECFGDRGPIETAIVKRPRNPIIFVFRMQQTSMYCRIIQVFSIMSVMLSINVEIHKVRTMRFLEDGMEVGLVRAVA